MAWVLSIVSFWVWMMERESSALIASSIFALGGSIRTGVQHFCDLQFKDKIENNQND